MMSVLVMAALLPFPREFKATGGFVKDPPVTESRDASLPPEGYWLTVGKDGAKIAAAWRSQYPDKPVPKYMEAYEVSEYGRAPTEEVSGACSGHDNEREIKR